MRFQLAGSQGRYLVITSRAGQARILVLELGRPMSSPVETGSGLI